MGIRVLLIKKKHVLGIILVAITMSLALTNPVRAALIDNSDGTVTDDDTGLMWLLANPMVSKTWDEAVAWADNLVFAGHDDWRLPSANDLTTGLPDTTWWSTNNEWGHLYAIEWHNPAYPSDTLPMTGYSWGYYWTGTPDPSDPSKAYAFFASFDGIWLNNLHPKSEILACTAVRSVGPPPTYDVTIDAYCNTEATAISVDITMDGAPTVFNTPHAFTGLTGTHTFTVPATDANDHPFKQWNTGEISTTITVNSAGTYTASYEAARRPLVPVIESSDSTGTKKDSFLLGEAVYAYGSGYSPSTSYHIFVVNDVVTWSDGMTIPAPVSEITVTSDSSGNILPSPVWGPPLTLGKYDIVVDVNGNGKYDVGVDALDDSDIEITAGFQVIPEVPFGTIMTLFSMIIAFVGFLGFKRFRPKFPQQ